jgi:hypothetical protein
MVTVTSIVLTLSWLKITYAVFTMYVVTRTQTSNIKVFNPEPSHVYVIKI